jgi:mevalonate kinase
MIHALGIQPFSDDFIHVVGGVEKDFVPQMVQEKALQIIFAMKEISDRFSQAGANGNKTVYQMGALIQLRDSKGLCAGLNRVQTRHLAQLLRKGKQLGAELPGMGRGQRIPGDLQPLAYDMMISDTDGLYRFEHKA